MMKNKLCIALAVSIAVLSMLTACSGEAQTADVPLTTTVSQTTEEQTTAKELTTEETTAEETTAEKTTVTTTEAKSTTTNKDTGNNKKTGYAEAYKEYLKNYLEENQSDTFDGQFSLHYLDDDNIPELFVSEGSFHQASVIILTFDGKEVKKIGTSGPFGVTGFEERKGIIVETITGKNHVISNIYKYENGDLTEYWSGTHRYPGYPYPDSEELYLSNGQTVDKATYERDLERYMPDVVKCNRIDYDAEEFPTKKFVVDGKEYAINAENIEKYL